MNAKTKNKDKDKKMKNLLASAGMVLGLFVVSANVSAANAAYCEYRASYEGRILITDGANARKMGTACKRARRQCNRKLDRLRRRNKVGRGVSCGRVTFG